MATTNNYSHNARSNQINNIVRNNNISTSDDHVCDHQDGTSPGGCKCMVLYHRPVLPLFGRTSPSEAEYICEKDLTVRFVNKSNSFVGSRPTISVVQPKAYNAPIVHESDYAAGIFYTRLHSVDRTLFAVVHEDSFRPQIRHQYTYRFPESNLSFDYHVTDEYYPSMVLHARQEMRYINFFDYLELVIDLDNEIINNFIILILGHNFPLTICIRELHSASVVLYYFCVRVQSDPRHRAIDVGCANELQQAMGSMSILRACQCNMCTAVAQMATTADCEQIPFYGSDERRIANEIKEIRQWKGRFRRDVRKRIRIDLIKNLERATFIPQSSMFSLFGSDTQDGFKEMSSSFNRLSESIAMTAPPLLASVEKIQKPFTSLSEDFAPNFNLNFEKANGSIENIVSILTDFVPFMKDAIGKANDNASVLKEKLSEGIEVRHEVPVLTSVKDAIKSLLTPRNIGIVFALVVGFLGIRNKSKLMVCASILVAIFGSIFKPILNYIMGCDEPEFVPQADVGTVCDVGFLLKMVWEFLTHGKDKSPLDIFLKNTNWANVTSGNLSSLVEALQQLMRYVIRLLKFDPTRYVLFEPYPTAFGLLSEVDELIQSFKGEDIRLADISSQISNLTRRIEAELRLHAAHSDFANMKTSLTAALRKLEKFDTEVSLRGAGKSLNRVPPSTVLIIGDSGVGKSRLLEQIQRAFLLNKYKNQPHLIRKVLSDIKAYVFERDLCSKYWEGYFNQPIVILDEVGQSVSVAGTDKANDEFFDFLNMVNDKSSPLNMAFGDKGKVFFDSELVVGTTNLRLFDIQTIKTPEAYDRRWQKKYEAYVIEGCYEPILEGENTRHKPFSEYHTRQYCSDKGMSEQETDVFIKTSSFLRFREVHSVVRPSNKPRADISCKEFINEILLKVDEREKASRSKRDAAATVNEMWMAELGIKIDEPTLDECNCLGCKKLGRDSLWSNWWFYHKKCPGMKPPDEAYPPDNSAPAPTNVPLDPQDLFDTKSDEPSEADSLLGEDDTITPQMAGSNKYGYTKEEILDRFLCFSKITEMELNLSPQEMLDLHLEACDMHSGFPFKQSLVATSIYALIGQIWLAHCALKCTYGLYKMAKSYFSKSGDTEDDPISAEDKVIPNIMNLRAPEKQYNIARKNVVEFLKKTNSGMLSHVGYGTAMGGTIICIPHHFVVNWRKALSMNPDFELYVRRIGEGLNGTVHPIYARKVLQDNYIFLPPNDGNPEGVYDVAFIKLDPFSCQPFQNLRKWISSGNLPSNEHGYCVRVINGVIGPSALDYTKLWVMKRLVNYVEDGTKFSTPNTIVYQANTREGDCGLPLFNASNTSEGILLGIHIASASSGGAVAGPILPGHVEAAFNHFANAPGLDIAQMIRADDPLIRGSDDSFFDDLDEGEDVEGKLVLGRTHAPMVPVKTQIIRSPLYGKVNWPSVTCPAFLREFTNKAGEKIDPINQSNAKYSRSSPKFDLGRLESCIMEYTDWIINHAGSKIEPVCDRRVLTFEEACAGIHGVDGLDGIPRKTSAGYPYTLSVDNRGKADFFGNEGDYEFVSTSCKILQSRCEKIINSARKGERMTHIFLDFPKDERRPRNKVQEGRTRKISASPICLSICIRQYFGAFVQWYMANRIFNGSAVGIDAYSAEIDFLVPYIGGSNLYEARKPSSMARVVAGDFGNFDGSLPYSLMMRFLLTVENYYKGSAKLGDDKVRFVLMTELCNSRHILPNGTVYEWVGSNASGNPLTTVLNTWCNNIILRYSICSMYPEDHPFKLLERMRGKVKIIAYGDDNLISVAQDDWLKRIDQNSLTEKLSEIGFEYTDEEKRAGTIEDRDIFGVSFLKRSFARNDKVRFPGRDFVAPLALSTILESVQWTKRKDETFSFVRDNVSKMLLELSLHSEDVFNEHAPTIVTASIHELGYTPVMSTYDLCRSYVLSGGISDWH